MTDRRQHPSGRPIRREHEVKRGFYNIPPSEPLTPGLRRRDGAQAIGFHLEPPDDEE